jgi:hypothetical protein
MPNRRKMPYISRKMKCEVWAEVEALEAKIMVACGGVLGPKLDQKKLAKFMTYVFFRLLKAFYAVSEQGWYELGDVDKILDSVKDEFHRRFIHPYEREKLEENKDVDKR